MGSLICSRPECKKIALYGSFCTKCGGKLIKMPELRCPKEECKSVVSEGSNFCAECGTQLRPHESTIPEEMRLVLKSHWDEVEALLNDVMDEREDGSKTMPTNNAIAARSLLDKLSMTLRV